MGDVDTAELLARIEKLEADIDLKDGIIAELLKRLYGAKSEKLDTARVRLDTLHASRDRLLAAMGA